MTCFEPEAKLHLVEVTVTCNIGVLDLLSSLDAPWSEIPIVIA